MTSAQSHTCIIALNNYPGFENSQTTRGIKLITKMVMEMVLILVMVMMERPPPTPRRSGDDDGDDYSLSVALEQ